MGRGKAFFFHVFKNVMARNWFVFSSSGREVLCIVAILICFTSEFTFYFFLQTQGQQNICSIFSVLEYIFCQVCTLTAEVSMHV